MVRNEYAQLKQLVKQRGLLVVKAFCKEHAIAYCEASMLQSYKEILHFLHHVSAPLRKEKS